MQEAVSVGLEKHEQHNFFPDQLAAYTERRDALCSYFDKLGLSYTLPDGAYYVMVDFTPVKIPKDFPIPPSCQGRGEDFAKCWWMCQEIKVAAIPVSEFYSEDHASIGERFVRFSFVSYPAVEMVVNADDRVSARTCR